MDTPLRLYVNRGFVVPGMSYIPLLYLFWGPYKRDTTPHVMSALLKHNWDKACFDLVDDIESAEYVLMPHDYWRLKSNRPDVLQKIIDEAKSHDKPLLIDASGDVAGIVDVPNARVLRINQYRFELPPYEIKVPVPCEDLLEVYRNGSLSLREKGDLPVVGFAGWASLRGVQRIRSLLKELPIRMYALFDRRYAAKIKGVFWRERANSIFKRSSRVKTNFIIRSSYSGHTSTAEKDIHELRREFVQNIDESDYTLVVRGDANEATRFYETLSMGRIPVLIDTAVVLPLEGLVNYKEFCVIIDHAEIERAPDILAEFHRKITPDDFKKMQKKARDAFERYLRYDSFSPYLVDILRR